jgi:hypothetical protein
MTTGGSASEITGTGRRRPCGGVRDGLVAAGVVEFARQEPGLFATAFALPHQHAYGACSSTICRVA